MNNIIPAKRNSAIFLATILLAGTIATILPSAQAQPYYEDTYKQDYQPYLQDYEPEYPSYGKDSYKSKDSSSVSINKLKCINNNLNINGNNNGDINVGNKEQGYSGANSYSSGYSDGYGNNKQGKGFDCVINNNNTNTNIGGAGNQTIPPGPTKTTLTVTKTVECVDENEENGGLALSIQQAGNIEDCDELEAQITPSDFTIDVTDTDPVPSQFQGSATGTQVQIGSGPYEVEETPSTDVTSLLAINPNITLVTTFTGGCTPTGTGTIEAGVAETCNIINTFTIEGDDDDRTTLNVAKAVTCTVANGDDFEDCDNLLATITPADFNIQVTGNDPQPPSFQASQSPGTAVQIGPGVYTVTEIPNAEVAALLVPGSGITLTTQFSEDCQQVAATLSASGTIEDPPVPEFCLIGNHFTINEDDDLTATGSPLMAQGTTEEDLSATEKMTKLKQQWLELLP